ncbi:DUF349 domain-containing protein [Frigoriflavimonas asaccharolytica]|uniref:DUF349 domain-containing protein n=1 Tax=Frigoriflavimonas asaccharolytica TaxID=2735899 RepID=A0A8J8G788_9FLAO|nr:DUF349 domain-containing protein [Frigoriflavimonas asaccharolytica]NRS92453.1 hypothetical protein [Frigoriflavimonas asaccharolytica]
MTTENSEKDLSQDQNENLQKNLSDTNQPSTIENTEAEPVNELADALVEEHIENAEEVQDASNENSEEDKAKEHTKTELGQSEEVNTNDLSTNEENSEEKAIEKETIGENSTAEKSSNEATGKQEIEKFLTLPDIIEGLAALQKTATAESWSRDSKEFNKYKALGYAHLHAIEKTEKEKWAEGENSAEDFKFENENNDRFGELMQGFKKVQEEFHQNQDQQQTKNLEIRQQIIEKLKNLNSNADAGTNLFKEIRIIKEQWTSAGQVPKADFKIINNNYFHHLTQFYEILDLKKEYLEQEYAHNLEKREHIILRAKELLTEESVQKALNELQYLHKLWKEEAVPVAEEFREKTWQEFKDISDKIHDRRAELSEMMDTEHAENLAKKNAIIEEIKKLTAPEKEPNHSYWQNSLKKIETLRADFLKTGSVSRKLSNQNWQDFKDALKIFNNNKNHYYKDQKNSQQKNLDDKLKLIQTAKDNNTSEDWDTMVSMYKNLQEDWKKIGHVPRSMADKIWNEFRDACNVFFENFRDKSKAEGEDWKANFATKKDLLEQLKQVTNEEGSVGKIEEIKTAWNAVGKIPKDKLQLHTDFNKTLRDKLKLNNIQEYALKEEGLSEHQITDKARRIKSQISDMEAEIAKLENNLGFFSNPSRENPLLSATYKNIDDKKANLEALKKSLHEIIAG